MFSCVYTEHIPKKAVISAEENQRPFCVKELEWAVEYGKPIQVIIDVQYKNEIGNIIDLTWTGRLEDHLGYYKCELINSYSYNFFDSSLTLNALNSFCDLQII